jgi:hypothetical protein
MNDSGDIEKYIESPESLLALCQDIVNKLDQKRKGSDLDVQERQLREISNTIDKLERAGVSVPDELRALKTGLLAKLSVREETRITLENLADGFEAILKDMGRLIEKDNTGKTITRRTYQGSRSKKPKTDRHLLRQEIIKALQKFGGRAQVHRVLEEMEKQLNGRLLPRDLESLKDGSIVWQNSAQWERFHMIKEGILKDNSPHGIWELSEVRK